MNAPHPDLQAFVDQELSAPDADAVRLHLADCASCQRTLHGLMQLDAFVEAAETQRPKRWPWVASGLAIAAAAVLGVFFATRDATSQPPRVVAQLTGPRHLDARVGWGPADRWRPYEAVRGGGSADAVPLTVLAELEQRGDQAALAGALIVSGAPDRARALLEGLADSADRSADLSAAALAQGHFAEALELAQDALDLSPKHARALWNKALAARALGFNALAAKTFGAVAALGEAGWADEARGQQQALDATWQRAFEVHQRALDAAAVMVLDGKPMPDELVRAAPGPARVYLTYALRLAGDRAAVEALSSTAAALDALTGGDAVRATVQRAAAADLKARAALRPQRRAFFVDFLRSLPAWGLAPRITATEAGLGEGTPAFVARVLKEGTAEDVVLVLLLASEVRAHFEAFSAAATATGDPWFRFALQLEQGKRELAARRAGEAERAWLEVARTATTTAPFRALQAHERLALLYNEEHRAAEAQHEATAALTLAREQGDVAAQLRLLATLGDAARFRNLRGLSAAALEERALWQPELCEPRRSLEESAAALEVMMLEPARARLALERAASCGEPLSPVGAFSFADVMRLDPRDGDLPKLMAMLTLLRAEADERQRLVVDHIEGRARLDVDRAGAEALLREAIAGAKTLGPADAMGRKLHAYSYGLLRSDAARRDDFPALFTHTADELGHPLPPGCALIVEVQDDRVAVAGRDSLGAVTGAFARVAPSGHHREGLEPAEIARVVAPVALRAGEGCELLVYAGYPLHGLGGWLPDELAWSYATGLAKRPALPGRTVVVSDVETPAELGLKPLSSWSTRAQIDDRITGAQATPERVLAALSDAAFVEFDVHGLVNTGSDDTAALVLAPGAHGHALTAATVSGATLGKHPVVLLGACRAATAAPYMHEAWSLPRAFAQAGARAIVAAPVDLPDGEARRFFGRLTERLLRGESPATALRDERTRWLREEGAVWVREVLVFE